MADLPDTYRILYFLFEAHREGRTVSLHDLQTRDELQFMHKVGNLNPAVRYLRKTGYVEGPDSDLQLTGKGLMTTIAIFYKFLDYIKRDYPDKLSSWINTFEYYKDDSWGLIRNTFFHI